MKTAYINAKIYNTNKECFESKMMVVEDGRIAAFDGAADQTVDCGGAYMIPGMVDVHTHGRGGVSTDSASVDKLCEMANCYAKAGTTSFMATLATDPTDWYPRCIVNIKETVSRQSETVCGANIIGIIMMNTVGNMIFCGKNMQKSMSNPPKNHTFPPNRCVTFQFSSFSNVHFILIPRV